MQSFRGIRKTTNPYLAQLIASLPSEVESLPFSWQTAILGRYDVLHVHWPEVLLRGRPGLRFVARRVLFAVLLVRLRLTRVVVVRTLHNVGTHEKAPGLDRVLLASLDRATATWVRLNPATTAPHGATARTIPHGDYRAWFERYARGPVVPGRVLLFGLIRPYKGVERLLDAFRGLNDDEASLRIVGKPSDAGIDGEVRRRAARDPRVGLALAYVDDADLAAEVGAAELVVLPYAEMHNSGALLLALSLDRPVLVPAGPVTDALRDEVGREWVRTYRGELDSRVLAEALVWSGNRHSGQVAKFRDRSWDSIGLAHRDAYRAAVRTRT